MIKTIYYQGIERALHVAFAMDPDHQLRAASLDGCIIDIVLSDSPGSMRLKFIDKMIRVEELSKDGSVAADVELHGRVFDLFQFGIRHGEMHDPVKHPVYFKGDVRLGREVQALFSELDLDWEGLLSNYIGDVPAHCIARLAGGLKDIKDSWKASVSDNVQHYIANESSCIVLKDESRLLFDEISDLRDSVDRLELKANQLLNE